MTLGHPTADAICDPILTREMAPPLAYGGFPAEAQA